MTEPDLYKFFSGNFSEKEKLNLKEYLDKYPEYSVFFRKERDLYNLSLFSSRPVLAKEKDVEHRRSIKNIAWSFLKIAGIFLLAVFSLHLLHNNESVKSKTIAYQTITVPFGQRVNLDLPDGSKVWLNAGTSIKYPVSFNDDMREVILDGEAYFEICKNENSPFWVSAGNHKIKVLGTTFNVNVDIPKSKFELALFEGSVTVIDLSFPNRTIKVEPNTLLSLVDDDLQVLPITHPGKFDWRKGILCFNKERFEDIMAVFERSFGCRITVQNEDVNQYLYTGTFIQTDGIDYALNLLRESLPFSYSRDKSTNTISIK